ncbi:MAG: protease modulator HflC [Gammaproteobacteria bacterium]|nr:protease modulator HflC [Gammaproteobacteria bacterium]
MNNKQIAGLIVAVVAVLLLLLSLFTVEQGHQAIVMRLGEIGKTANGQVQVYNPGLHMKMPFVDTVLDFDTRIQTLDIAKSRIVTSQKKDVNVDYYVKWRITDLEKYYNSTSGLIDNAEQLLVQQVNNSLRAEFGNRTIPEVVSDDRSQIMQSLLTAANQSAAPLGISVIDVRIKTIDLPDEVSVAVFNRMRAERERVASEHRAEGKSAAEAIRAKADADAKVIEAKAIEQAAILKAEGDKKAAKIYADAYNKNPGFFAFYRSMLAYQGSFNKNDVLVLSPNSEFFKYMNNSSGSKQSSN